MTQIRSVQRLYHKQIKEKARKDKVPKAHHREIERFKFRVCFHQFHFIHLPSTTTMFRIGELFKKGQVECKRLQNEHHLSDDCPMHRDRFFRCSVFSNCLSQFENPEFFADCFQPSYFLLNKYLLQI